MTHRMPHVVVAEIVERDGRFLFVEEDIGGRAVLNQPAGHWEDGESLLQAVVRETLEEAAWHITPVALLGIYSHHAAEVGLEFLRFAFLARAERHEPQRPLDTGILRSVWLSPDELAHSTVPHRSPLVMRCVRDALAGQRFPLHVIAA
jgi:ADP-ribose pyrophosphatase YjhB (NUDIX family)